MLQAMPNLGFNNAAGSADAVFDNAAHATVAGGSSNTAKTAKAFFHPKIREKVLTLYKVRESWIINYIASNINSPQCDKMKDLLLANFEKPAK